MEVQSFNPHESSSERSFFRIRSYEVKTSKNNLKIPVVNDVHLHSMYDPAKEAKNIIGKHVESLEAKNNVLVFGLGYAYHVYELCRTLEKFHGNNYKVVVIEPNEETYRDCIKYNLFPNKNIEVYSGINLDSIFSEEKLIRFLTDKPCIITHTASFELYRKYFEAFMKYEAPRNISAITKHIKSRDLRSYLYMDSNSRSLDSYLKDNVLTKDQLNSQYDHLLLSFTNFCSGDF